MSNKTSSPLVPPTTPRTRGGEDARVITIIGPTVSLDARPIVVPILSCVFGFPVLALAVICALRYRAKRARKRAQLKRLQAASARWRNQEDRLRPNYSVSDVERETSFVPRDPVLMLLELPPLCTHQDLGESSANTTAEAAEPQHNGGRLLSVPKEKRSRCRLDNIMTEHSDVDFEYTEMDVL